MKKSIVSHFGITVQMGGGGGGHLLDGDIPEPGLTACDHGRRAHQVQEGLALTDTGHRHLGREGVIDH